MPFQKWEEWTRGICLLRHKSFWNSLARKVFETFRANENLTGNYLDFGLKDLIGRSTGGLPPWPPNAGGEWRKSHKLPQNWRPGGECKLYDSKYKAMESSLDENWIDLIHKEC